MALGILKLGGSGGGGGGSGTLAGDVTGPSGANVVTAIRGIPVALVAPISGQQYVFNGASGELEPVTVPQVYASGAAAAADAPHIDGTSVVIYDGSTGSDNGTYRVTANGGATWPGDYTKTSDATNTASEVAAVDAAGWFQGAADVEAILAVIGAGTVSGPSAALPDTASAVIDSFSAAAARSAVLEVVLTKGTQTYRTRLNLANDGTDVVVSESDSVAGPGVSTNVPTFNAYITAGTLNVSCTTYDAGWSYRVRRIALQA